MEIIAICALLEFAPVSIYQCLCRDMSNLLLWFSKRVPQSPSMVKPQELL